jgi:hypothetical protein
LSKSYDNVLLILAHRGIAIETEGTFLGFIGGKWRSELESNYTASNVKASSYKSFNLSSDAFGKSG